MNTSFLPNEPILGPDSLPPGNQITRTAYAQGAPHQPVRSQKCKARIGSGWKRRVKWKRYSAKRTHLGPAPTAPESRLMVSGILHRSADLCGIASWRRRISDPASLSLAPRGEGWGEGLPASERPRMNTPFLPNEPILSQLLPPQSPASWPRAFFIGAPISDLASLSLAPPGERARAESMPLA